MQCDACQLEPPLENTTGPRGCAFTDGMFSVDNWACAFLNLIRMDSKAKTVTTHEEQSAAILAIEEHIIVIGWYKSRGRTEYAGLLFEETLLPLSLDLANRIYHEHYCRNTK